MTVSFSQLGLAQHRVQCLEELGFTAPTPIQAESIPQLLQGLDMIGQAQTGTGKTAAFSLPILERIDPDVAAVQALILTPTRELAVQVSQAIQSFKADPKLRVLAIYGGQSIDRQITQLRRGVQIVVGTPGRVLDLLGRGNLVLSQLSWFVLDEADEMLNMGFIPDVREILRKVPDQRQTALFSATMPPEIRRLSQQFFARSGDGDGETNPGRSQSHQPDCLQGSPTLGPVHCTPGNFGIGKSRGGIDLCAHPPGSSPINPTASSRWVQRG